MISTRSVELVIDTVVCLTLAKWETVSGQFGGYLMLSDNGPSYVSSGLGTWLEDNGIRHIRGRPYHPMTQGKIERYHRSMKNRILLDNYYLPGQLEQSIEEFVRYYNNCRYHESLDNLTPA